MDHSMIQQDNRPLLGGLEKPDKSANELRLLF